MFCPNCGTQCPDNSNFCSTCGNPLQAPTPAPAPQNAVYRLYIDPNGLTLFNYKFDIRDETGAVRYKGATITESMIRYNAMLYSATEQPLIKISQQSKMTFTAMNFDFLTPDGILITDAIQQPGLVDYTYTIGRYGIVLKGNFLSLNFDFYQNNIPIAHIEKKFFSWGDSYELTYTDKSMEGIFLASVMMIQLVCAAQRNRRRR